MALDLARQMRPKPGKSSRQISPKRKLATRAYPRLIVSGKGSKNYPWFCKRPECGITTSSKCSASQCYPPPFIIESSTCFHHSNRDDEICVTSHHSIAVHNSPSIIPIVVPSCSYIGFKRWFRKVGNTKNGKVINHNTGLLWFNNWMINHNIP